MFFERVPIQPNASGTTSAQIFQDYGIPPGRLQEIIGLSQNAPLRASVRLPAGGRIGLDTLLARNDTSQAPGGSTMVLPMDFNVSHAFTISFSPTGGRVTAGGKSVTPLRTKFLRWVTHGIMVNFQLWNASGSTYAPCRRVRWVQTVKRRYPANQKPTPDLVQCCMGHLDEFVDISVGNNFPWYNFAGTDNPGQDPGSLDDRPAGPAALPGQRGLTWLGTASVAVWTGKRVTLAESFTYGFFISAGSDAKSITPNPAIRRATAGEVQEHLRILKRGQNMFGNPTGGANVFNYRLAPAAGSINEGL